MEAMLSSNGVLNNFMKELLAHHLVIQNGTICMHGVKTCVSHLWGCTCGFHTPWRKAFEKVCFSLSLIVRFPVFFMQTGVFMTCSLLQWQPSRPFITPKDSIICPSLFYKML